MPGERNIVCPHGVLPGEPCNWCKYPLPEDRQPSQERIQVHLASLASARQEKILELERKEIELSGETADLQRRLAEAQAQLSEQGALLRQALEALKPFGNAVFNDNGDITLQLSNIQTGDYVKAKAVLSSPAARKAMER